MESDAKISPASQHHHSIESCALRAKNFYDFFARIRISMQVGFQLRSSACVCEC